ncbi:MAG: CDC27 family protein [Clostridia bacterium]|nr:CDC27 family protein [Clostridia bacterium]
MDVLTNTIFSGNAILIYIAIIIIIFIIYALDLINNELRERNLENLLYKKLEVDDYLKVVSEFAAKSRNKTKITKYNIYKAIGLYYKGENDKALEWLKMADSEVQKSEDIYLKILYTSTIIKILFTLGYNDTVEAVFQKNKAIFDRMLPLQTYKFDAYYLLGTHDFLQGNAKEAYEKLQEAKKNAMNKLEKTMASYQLAKICLEISKIEEAELEVENVMNTKRKSKNYLFIYEELEKVIKERRSQTVNISSVDKDLEEEQRQEALEKMNKEVEEAIENEEIKPKEQTEDADVKKLREEEDFQKQLENMTKNLHNEMLVQNNLNK